MGLWDLATGQRRQGVAEWADTTPLTFSRDGRWLVTQQGDGGGDLELWDTSTGHRLRELGTEDEVFLASLSAEGNLLATQNVEEGTLIVRETLNGEILYKIDAPAGEDQMSATVAFSPDGNLLGLAHYTNLIQIFEAQTGRELKRLQGTAINFSPDGQRAIIGGQMGGAPTIIDLESSKETKLLAGSSRVQDLALTGDGRTLIAGMLDDTAKIWDLSTGQITGVLPGPASASVAVTSSGKLVATGGMRGKATVWELDTGHLIQTLREGKKEGWQDALVRFTPDGQALAVGSDDTVTLWDTTTWKELWQTEVPLQSMTLGNLLTPQPENPKGIQQMTFSPDGRLLAISTSGFAGVWDTATGEKRYTFGGGGLTSLLELALPSFGSDTSPSSGMLNNPLDLSNQMMGQRNIKTLAFSPNGQWLFSIGIMGKQLWDADSGRPAPMNLPTPGAPIDPKKAMKNFEIHMGKGGTFSPDGTTLAYGHGRLIKFTDLNTGEERPPLTGHTSDITALVYTPDGRFLISGANDGNIKVWASQTGKEQVSLIAVGNKDYVGVTPEQYYRMSRSRIKGVAFRVKGKLYPFDQFDLRFNRPDIILERLGRASPNLIQSYRHAYQKRLKKMGLTQDMLGTDFHLPEVEILTHDVPVSVTTPDLQLRVKSTDSKYPLDRLNVFVNNIPIHGTAGLPLPDKPTSTHTQDIHVPLVPGRNKIQVSVLNQKGTESLRQTIYTVFATEETQQDIYVLAIGVSQYKDTAYNLRYAAKDAHDLVHAYNAIKQREGTDPTIHVLILTDQKATRSEILKAKDWLRQSTTQDLVVVFAAGHGMTDEQSNYYFGTHDIDPKQPGLKGLPYEEFEFLLDGIPSLQKVLLLDTCFSGEIDKDEAIIVKPSDPKILPTAQVTMRSFKAARGISIVADTGAEEGSDTLSPDVLHFQQDWFADLRRGTGAVVISSSSGNEYSLEGGQWRNGVFTYAVLQGLQHGRADSNSDHVITVSELQNYVIDQVRTLTQGGQNPTIRRENLEYDFVVY